jgi:hypothetical protein
MKTQAELDESSPSLWRQSRHWRWVTISAATALALGGLGASWKLARPPGNGLNAVPVVPRPEMPQRMALAGDASRNEGSSSAPARYSPVSNESLQDRFELPNALPASALLDTAAAAPQSRSSAVWANDSGAFSGIGGSVSGGGLIAGYCCAGASSTVWAAKTVATGRHYWELTLSVRPGETHADTWTAAGVGASPDGGRDGGRYFSGSSADAMSIEVGRDKFIRSGDVLMFAFDADQRQAFWGVNGQWRNGSPGEAGGANLSGRSGQQFAAFGTLSASSRNTAPEGDRWIANFGNQKFRYPLPKGFDSYAASGQAIAPADKALPIRTERTAPVDSAVVYRTQITVGGQTVALPEGSFSVLARFKATPAFPAETVLLGDINKGQLGQMVAVQAASSTVGERVTVPQPLLNACERTAVLFTQAVLNTPSVTQCWWVNHAAALRQDAGLFHAAQLELQGRKLDAPGAQVNAGFVRADASGYAAALYYFDPLAADISTPASSWHNSPWHSSRIDAEPNRRAFVDKTVAWARSWAPIYFASK